MITYDRYLAILAQSDAAVQQAAGLAFAKLLEKIRQGQAPRSAIDAIMREFNADTLTGFQEAFSAVLESSLGVKEIKAWPVGGVKLSNRLYANAQQVSATTRQIIVDHMKGLHNAQDLRKALYEGYDFQKDPLDVIQPLPKYLQVEFDKFKAASLKTPALRAAYLDAIRKAEAGAGMDEIEKKLRIAFYERNRYFANRIARTELHRNYTDQQARDLMQQDRIEYVQLRLSSKHPKADICDLHARLDAYGLGAGVYPKADAPKPPFHPHCYCVVSPMIALISPKPKFNPKAERAFLNSLPKKEARDVAGSFAKLERAKAGESLEEIYNEGKDPLYQWKRVGDILSPATEADVVVSNAYEVAKAGGRHRGVYTRYLNQRAPEIEKSIRSFTKRIKEHQDKIDNPMRYVQPDITEQHLVHLVSTLWPEEIMDFEMKIEIMKGILRERSHE